MKTEIKFGVEELNIMSELLKNNSSLNKLDLSSNDNTLVGERWTFKL